jgi:hypothetical protein
MYPQGDTADFGDTFELIIAEPGGKALLDTIALYKCPGRCKNDDYQSRSQCGDDYPGDHLQLLRCEYLYIGATRELGGYTRQRGAALLSKCNDRPGNLYECSGV